MDPTFSLGIEMECLVILDFHSSLLACVKVWNALLGADRSGEIKDVRMHDDAIVTRVCHAAHVEVGNATCERGSYC